MRDRLAVVGLGSGMDRSLERMKELGLDLVVVTDVETERVRSAASEVVLADPGDAGAVVAALARAGVTSLDGVMSLGFDNPPVISRLCRTFRCPGLGEEAARDCTYKDRRIRILEANGLRTPRFAVAERLGEALAAIESIGLPVVVKPTDRSGSLGVAKITRRAAAAERVEEALEVSRSGRVLVEEFLVGTEHTVAGFSIRGQVWFTGFSDRDYSRKEEFPPYFFEAGDTIPTALDAAREQQVKDVVARGVRALRLDPAFFNADVLVTAGHEVVLIELTGRITGARIATEVVPLATGVDPLPNAVRLALGRPLELSELEPTRDKAVVQRYLPSAGAVVTWVGDIDSVVWPEGVYDLFWNVEPRVGMELPPYRCGEDVVAGVIAEGRTVAHAERVAAEALARLPLRVSRGRSIS